jgi:riboflavin kinase/FMN adenylyltransferase
MHIIDDLNQVHIDEPVVLTIGKFNGMHLGHRYLLEQVVERAHAIGGRGVAITFEPHPTLVLRPEIERVYLAPADERLRLIGATELDMLIVLRFDEQLMMVSAEQFMRRLCGALRLRELWVGPEFRLGHRAQGTVAVLQELGVELSYTVHPVAKLEVGGEPVSATRIRELLLAGEVDRVPELLGRAFAVAGEVVHGDHRGRTIGFPTANVAVGARHSLPADGVYACRVTVESGQEHPAVTNVGVRPTFGQQARLVEAHLLDWSGDLYGQTIRVAFVERIRGERRFSGVDELREQIGRDAAAARAILG